MSNEQETIELTITARRIASEAEQ